MKRDWFSKAIEIIGGIVFLAIIAITFIQCVSRYVFRYAFTWGEEIPIFLMMLLVMLGATEGVRTKAHIDITILVDRFPPKIRKMVDITGDILCFAFLILIVWNSRSMVKANFGRISSASHINMGYVYAILPVFCTIMAVLLAVRIVKRIMDKGTHATDPTIATDIEES